MLNYGVVFGIDGLEDTSHIYRVNTSFKKVIENAEAFIKQGGLGTWQFIVFKHNVHQLESAKMSLLGKWDFIILYHLTMIEKKK